jgi:F5/8 type C domain/Glycosyl hydrolases family 2, sugar binding domain/Glycosyl hydrolases family 2/Glycosyl hydrolases family 2, TIM barrel domain
MNCIRRLMLSLGIGMLALSPWRDADAGDMVAEKGKTLDLAGTWSFAVDDKDVGVTEKWYSTPLKNTIRLPGTMSGNGYGTYGSPGKLAVQDWCGWKEDPQWHSILKKDYRGAAWYQRDVVIPQAWEGMHLRVELEKVCWVSELWVDGHKVGRQDSLVAPHLYEIGKLTPGKHTLSVRIDNRQLYELGCNTHAYHEQAVTIFNGVVGKMELSARSQVFILENQIYADPQTGECRFKLKVNNLTGKAVECSLAGAVGSAHGDKKQSVDPGIQEVNFSVSVDPKEIKLWDEFRPNLYTAAVTLKSPAGHDQIQRRFAFRTIKADGLRFLVNGKPVLMRGEASGFMFPLTGHPPMDVESWKKVLQTYKDFGLNLLRCHSFTPPPAAFDAADEIGFYIQAELPNGEVAIHKEEGNPWREAELFRILDTYGNHPSFVFFTNGNEAKTSKIEFLIGLTNKARKHDPRRLYTMISNPDASGRTEGFECDEFLVSHYSRMGGGRRAPTAPRRIEKYFNLRAPSTLPDYRNSFVIKKPYMSHEVGQWFVYPDVRTIEKYTGVVEPRNLQSFKELLEKRGLIKQLPDFVDASGRLSLLLYKEEIERSLRTPEYGGFQLLGLQDYYGQGSAFVGQIDNFFDPKPYVSAKAFRRFCGPQVPLARIGKFIWTSDETFKAGIELANYGPETLAGKTVRWRLTGAGKTLKEGAFGPLDIPDKGLLVLGEASCVLSSQTVAAKLKLEVEVEGTPIANDWDLWVYPAKLEMPAPDNVIVTETLTADIHDKLMAGARVVLLPGKFTSQYPTAMTTPFWTPLMFSNQRQILGFVCQADHPAFKAFPTDTHNNWQWYDLTLGGACMDLSDIKGDYRPLVQGIDQPQRCNRLGIVYEGKIGKGSLLVCTLDLNRDLKTRPVACQLRYSLIKYAASEDFHPATELNFMKHVPAKEFRYGLTPSKLVLEDLVKDVEADSEHENQWATCAVDGNPDTIWHSRHDDTSTPHPHQIIVELKRPVTMYGIIYAPRRDSEDGRIAKYRVYVSNDGTKWTLMAEGTLENSKQAQRVRFQKSVSASFVKLEALSEVNGKAWTSIAEIDLDCEKNYRP